MLSINISHIISTRKRGGYNPASKPNLKQYRGKESFNGEVKGCTKSKYRNILNNWFLTVQEGQKRADKEVQSKNKTNGNQQRFVAIGGLSEFQSTLHQSKVGESSLPTSTSRFRCMPFYKKLNPTDKLYGKRSF